MLSPVRRLSVTLVRPTQAVEIFSNISTAFGTLPSANIHGKFYGDRRRGTLLSGEVKHKRRSIWRLRTYQRLYIGNGAREEVSWY